ncbi:MAG: Fructose,6-bisphosphatase [Hydrocarboniphaga sp.]|uniref:inositol monophosphatase family protein n=1 Tax=Hydrocarboniphaga sp. TaxID=2033016 RepID=UPI002631F550|nr:inositol monophosphatase [Hydrocarboniphaga sp.]MDB5972942.1 Fructose,6-bisphosphatase [Hydrocarboniphaga sp.]
MQSALIESVGQLLQQAASELVLPRFRLLRTEDISEKSPGEIVTVVDRAVEAMLIPALTALRPGSRVVGEEGVSDDPALLDGLDQGEVWVVDPIDGTSNFVHGREDFGIMVALLRDGEAVMAWIQFPLTGSIAIAERGGGAYFDGERLQLAARDPQRPTMLRGIVKTSFMPEPMRSTIDARAEQHVQQRVAGTQSACGDYVLSARGQLDFSLYWRMLPWDHAPGTLLLTEAGGHVARHDAGAYRASDGGKGLLVARSREIWEQAHRLLL